MRRPWPTWEASPSSPALSSGLSAGRPITLIPLAAALALGVADDRFGLPAPLRLAAQLGVGVVIAVTVPVHLPGWIGVPLVVIDKCRPDQRLQPARRPRHAGGRRRGRSRRRLRHRPSWPSPSHGGLSGRCSGRVPVVQSPSGPDLPRGRRLLPAGCGHERPPRVRLGRWCRRLDGRDRPGPARRPGSRGRVRHRATSSWQTPASGRRPRPSLRPSRRPEAGPARQRAGPTSPSRS